MSTHIKCELSRSGILGAVRELSMYPFAKIEPASDELARGVAEKVKGYMSVYAHVDTGDLKANIINSPLIHAANGSYKVEVDPVHDGFHYAETERSRSSSVKSPDGTSHDFTRDNRMVAEEEAPILWEGIRTKL